MNGFFTYMYCFFISSEVRENVLLRPFPKTFYLFFPLRILSVAVQLLYSSFCYFVVGWTSGLLAFQLLVQR